MVDLPSLGINDGKFTIIRRILRIPVSMISRITNATVKQRAQLKKPMVNVLLTNQLKLAGHLIRAETRDPMRIKCMEPTKAYRPRTLPRGYQRVGYHHGSWWLVRTLAHLSKGTKPEEAYDRSQWRDIVQRRCAGAECAWAFGTAY